MAPRLSDVNDVADGEPYQIPWGTGGAGQPPVNIHGYDAAILIDVCKAVAQAHSKSELANWFSPRGRFGCFSAMIPVWAARRLFSRFSRTDFNCHIQTGPLPPAGLAEASERGRLLR